MQKRWEPMDLGCATWHRTMSSLQDEFPLPPEVVDQIVSIILSDHLLALLTTLGYPYAGWSALSVVTQINSLFRNCALRIVTILLPTKYCGSKLYVYPTIYH